jgi:surfeit locus 1 family protein
VLTPFLTDDGHSLLVDRGYVPKEKRDPATRTPVQGATRLVGVWRVPDAPGTFTPAPDTAHRIWYSRDLKAIAAADHIQLAAPVVIEADATPNPGGWPKGGQTVVSFRNEHLSYAVTWFGLAAGLLGVYLAYHVSKGRLRWD